MLVSWGQMIALVAAPALILLMGGRLAAGARIALVFTPLATWTIATIALTWLLPDPSDISAFLFFFLLVVPAISIPIAAVIATRLVRTRGRLVSALVLSVLGWIAGLVVGLLVDANGVAELPRYLWDYASGLALPAVYAGCGAVVAAGVIDNQS